MQADPSDHHRTATIENGRFCQALCVCGWKGPARRARSKARDDCEAHLNALADDGTSWEGAR